MKELQMRACGFKVFAFDYLIDFNFYLSWVCISPYVSNNTQQSAILFFSLTDWFGLIKKKFHCFIIKMEKTLSFSALSDIVFMFVSDITHSRGAAINQFPY